MHTQDGQTPASVAAWKDHSNCLEALVAAKADINTTDKVSARESWRWLVLECGFVYRPCGGG